MALAVFSGVVSLLWLSSVAWAIVNHHFGRAVFFLVGCIFPLAGICALLPSHPGYALAESAKGEGGGIVLFGLFAWFLAGAACGYDDKGGD